MKTLKLLFGMDARVSREQYLLCGATLFVLKCLGEVALYFTATGDRSRR